MVAPPSFGALALACALSSIAAEARLGKAPLGRAAIKLAPETQRARASLTVNASLPIRNDSFQAHPPRPSGNAAFQAYLHRCEVSRGARAAIKAMDQGNATVYSSKRASFVYMRDTWCALQFLGEKATSIVDVGSSWPPLLRSVNWMKGDRTIVSKYFPSGGGPVHACKEGKGKCKDPFSDINVVMEDFYEWTPDRTYDLVLCSQVLEHVDDPKRFLRKLLKTGRTVLASVPYHWKDYNMDYHKHHYLGLDDMRNWAGAHELYSFIADEEHGGPYSKRLLVVFQGTV